MEEESTIIFDCISNSSYDFIKSHPFLPGKLISKNIR
jgi:hypothetical protein